MRIVTLQTQLVFNDAVSCLGYIASFVNELHLNVQQCHRESEMRMRAET